MAGVVSIDKMQVGKKGGGKHWTKEQVAKRKKAAKKMAGGKPARMLAPEWLDDVAKEVWRKTVKDLAALNILDRADEDMLATYCDAVARHREATQAAVVDGKTAYTISTTQGVIVNPSIKAAQSYARIIMQCAERLGLTPNSRARLAKKIADETDDPNAELFE